MFNINATPTWNTSTVSTLTKLDEISFRTNNSNANGGGNGIYIGHFPAGVSLTISGYYKCTGNTSTFLSILTPRDGSGNL